MSERSELLSRRFFLIQQSLSELHGERAAFCASTAAYLMAMQHAAKLSMRQLRVYVSDPVSKLAYTESMEQFNLEHQRILQGIHERICDYLNEDKNQSIQLMASFSEVLIDIFKGEKE